MNTSIRRAIDVLLGSCWVAAFAAAQAQTPGASTPSSDAPPAAAAAASSPSTTTASPADTSAAASAAAAASSQVVVISATRHAMALVDAPAAISVVPRERIEQLGADDLLEALRGEQGITLFGRTI
ncbi:MAG: hypothetical protein KJ023_22755, partial [Burkholderiaceae bacterium]|nr:hypothetical protein [Burkholderiaceae bacterium]